MLTETTRETAAVMETAKAIAIPETTTATTQDLRTKTVIIKEVAIGPTAINQAVIATVIRQTQRRDQLPDKTVTTLDHDRATIIKAVAVFAAIVLERAIRIIGTINNLNQSINTVFASLKLQLIRL